MPDVNILIYAHREDERTHEAYREWLEQLVNGREPFALSTLAAVGFVRIVTNARIYRATTPLPAALATIDAIAAARRCQLLGPGPRHWQLFAQVSREAGAVGKAVADAQHAAVAIEHGARWVSRDADFARFERSGLNWQHLVLE